MAIDAADVALFTNDLRCLSHIILFGRNAKRKIMLNICLSVVTKVRCHSLVACPPSCYGLSQLQHVCDADVNATSRYPT